MILGSLHELLLFCFRMAASIPWTDLKKLKYLDEGAHCAVYAADYHGEHVAIKILKTELRTDAVAVHDLEVEAELMLEMSHQSVLKVFGHGHELGCPFLVMERLHGTLGQTLLRPMRFFFSRTARTQWLLSFALDLGEQLARAMLYIHEVAFPGHQVCI